MLRALWKVLKGREQLQRVANGRNPRQQPKPKTVSFEQIEHRYLLSTSCPVPTSDPPGDPDEPGGGGGGPNQADIDAYSTCITAVYDATIAALQPQANAAVAQYATDLATAASDYKGGVDTADSAYQSDMEAQEPHSADEGPEGRFEHCWKQEIVRIGMAELLAIKGSHR